MYEACLWLLQDFVAEDALLFRNVLRAEKCQFEELQRRVAPVIERKNTNCRESASAGERLAITLGFLA